MTQATAASAGVDVVYALGKGSTWNDNDELRYSLRALERNFLDLRRVFVVGERPGWLRDTAIHLPLPDRSKPNKDGNIIRKILQACRDARLSECFVRSSDDELFLRPTRHCEMRAYYQGPIGRPAIQGSYWRARLRRTAQYLRVHRRPTRFYDCHVPVPMRRDNFLRVMSSAPYRGSIGLTVDTLYFNLTEDSPRSPLTSQQARLHETVESEAELRERLATARYLNYHDRALNEVLRRFLEQTFPHPSCFER